MTLKPRRKGNHKPEQTVLVDGLPISCDGESAMVFMFMVIFCEIDRSVHTFTNTSPALLMSESVTGY